jgi:hypothetical protein
MSLLMTRQGFPVMKLKPNNNLHVGKILLLLTQPSMTDALASESNVVFFFYLQSTGYYEFTSGQTIKIFPW